MDIKKQFEQTKLNLKKALEIEKKNQDRDISTKQFELSKDHVLKATLHEQLITARENAYKMEL